MNSMYFWLCVNQSNTNLKLRFPIICTIKCQQNKNPHKPVSRINYTDMMSCHIKHNSNAWNTWEKASSLMNYIAALLSPSKKKLIGTHTHTHLCIHLFQLRLLQRRMMHDAWSMFHSPAVHYCGNSSKLCTHNEPRNLDSKGWWHFYVMSAER